MRARRGHGLALRLSPAAQAAGERRTACRGPPAPSLLDPRRDRLRVSARLAAQRGRLAGERLIELALAGALEDPGHLGEQVSAAVGELAQRSDRRGLLVGR